MSSSQAVELMDGHLQAYSPMPKLPEGLPGKRRVSGAAGPHELFLPADINPSLRRHSQRGENAGHTSRTAIWSQLARHFESMEWAGNAVPSRTVRTGDM